MDILARLADAAERDELALRRLEEAVSRLSSGKANAAGIATLLSGLRAGHAAADARESLPCEGRPGADAPPLR
jgi:hypothetical protein